LLAFALEHGDAPTVLARRSAYYCLVNGALALLIGGRGAAAAARTRFLGGVDRR
jgi:hypothetical protein